MIQWCTININKSIYIYIPFIYNIYIYIHHYYYYIWFREIVLGHPSADAELKPHIPFTAEPRNRSQIGQDVPVGTDQVLIPAETPRGIFSHFVSWRLRKLRWDEWLRLSHGCGFWNFTGGFCLEAHLILEYMSFEETLILISWSL